MPDAGGRLAHGIRLVVQLGRHARCGAANRRWPQAAATIGLPAADGLRAARCRPPFCQAVSQSSLHLLMRNRQLYRPGDPAYIRDALFVHGFDIGKRARDPESERYREALARLEPVAVEIGLRLIPCRTNLRHLPSKPGFWANRHSGAALAAVAHAAILGPSFLFIGGTYHVSTPVPVGSHPAVDGLMSSQRVSVIHDGSRFSRLEKVRELAAWPTALAVLRVCPEGPSGRANCGQCEKCLRTRLELLAAGVDETASLGPSLTPIELWDAAVPFPINHRAVRYDDLLPPLRARGFDALCRVLSEWQRSTLHYRNRTPTS